MNRDSTTESPADWREPLYECACAQKDSGSTDQLALAEQGFSVLGNYRDAAALRGECRTLLEKKQEEERLTREAVLAEPEKRRKRKTGTVIAAVVAAVLLICFFGPVQKQMYTGAQHMEEAGDFEGALSRYWKLVAGGTYADRSRGKIPELQERLVIQMISDGKYEEAADLAIRTGYKEAAQTAYRKWGEELLSEGNYKEALERYQQAEDEKGAEAVCLAWGRDLVNRGSYEEAIDILRDAGESGEQEELIGKCFRVRCERAIEKIPSLAGDITGIRETGEKLDDLDSQLKFCAALDQAGIDPGEVYPDGVRVKDISLKEYPVQSKATVHDLPAGKILVMMRVIAEPGVKDSFLMPNRVTGLSGAERLLENLEDSVLLMPGELYEIPEAYRAGSLEECELMLIAGETWDPFDTAVINKYSRLYMNGRYQTVTNQLCYPVFGAVDSVILHDRQAPEKSLTFAMKEDRPEDYTSANPLKSQLDTDKIKEIIEQAGKKDPAEMIADAQKEAEQKEKEKEEKEQEEEQDGGSEYDKYWGKPDPEFLRQALDQAVTEIREDLEEET